MSRQLLCSRQWIPPLHHCLRKRNGIACQSYAVLLKHSYAVLRVPPQKRFLLSGWKNRPLIRRRFFIGGSQYTRKGGNPKRNGVNRLFVGFLKREGSRHWRRTGTPGTGCRQAAAVWRMPGFVTASPGALESNSGRARPPGAENPAAAFGKGRAKWTLFGHTDGIQAYRKSTFLLQGIVTIVGHCCIHAAIRANNMFCIPFGLFRPFFGLSGNIHGTDVSTAELHFMQHSTVLLPISSRLAVRKVSAFYTGKRDDTVRFPWPYIHFYC